MQREWKIKAPEEIHDWSHQLWFSAFIWQAPLLVHHLDALVFWFLILKKDNVAPANLHGRVTGAPLALKWAAYRGKAESNKILKLRMRIYLGILGRDPKANTEGGDCSVLPCHITEQCTLLDLCKAQPLNIIGGASWDRASSITWLLQQRLQELWALLSRT